MGHDDDRTRVDEHLRRSDELCSEEQVEDGERGEVPDQRERAVEGVLEEDDRDSGGEEGKRREHPHEPDEKLLHQDSAFQTETGVSYRSRSATGMRFTGGASSMSFV